MATSQFNATALVAEFKDESLIAELAHLLLAHVDDQLNAVHTAVASSDGPALKSAAHKIKGGMGTFGAADVTKLAFALETLGREGRLDDAPALAARLDEEVRALCDSARSWLAERQPS